MAPSLRMALLLHETPDGGRHHDWMLEREPGADLVTFRVRDRLDRLAAGVFEADLIGDHRGAYLDFEGDISGGRGRVSRLAAGSCSRPRFNEGRCEVEIDWGAGPLRCAGERLDAPGVVQRWRFTIEPSDGAA